MNWYKEEVDQLVERRDKLPYQPQTVFYGSSTIRMWDSLYEDFKEYLPVNLGFGGSTLEACVYFFNRIVAPVLSARRMFIYAGDNDLGDGKSPAQVLDFFRQFESKIETYFPHVPCYFISIKPSISRWHINENIVRVNELISAEIVHHNNNMHFIDFYPSMLDESGHPNKNYYEEDGLHLSKNGYDILHQIIQIQGFPNY